jgi:hypothetical protein
MAFEMAPEVEKIAQPLIEGHHSHLLKAKISYVFKDKAWKTGDSQVVLGKAAKRNDLDRLLSHNAEDFVMLIGKDKWAKMDEIDQRCLVDHELCHMGVTVDTEGKAKFCLRKHVIEEFPENLARFERRREALVGLIEKPPSAIKEVGIRRISLAEPEKEGN